MLGCGTDGFAVCISVYLIPPPSPPPAGHSLVSRSYLSTYSQFYEDLQVYHPSHPLQS
jgi:hypothetical protein